jgi:hypothetical protein
VEYGGGKSTLSSASEITELIQLENRDEGTKEEGNDNRKDKR